MQYYKTDYVPSMPAFPGQETSSMDETDEDRKKRLARLAGLITGQPIGDIVGNEIESKIGQAQDKITGFGETIQNPQQAIQNRLAPITETIQNPQQAIQNRLAPITEAIENPEEAFKKRLGVSAPVKPEVQPTQQVQAPAIPQANVPQPELTMPNAKVPSPEIGQLPQPGPGTQVAGPAVLSTETAKQVAQTNPQIAANAIPGKGTDLNDVYHESVIAARNEQDPQKRRQAYAALLSNENVPEGYKAMANRFISEDYLRQREQQKAEEKIANATPNDLARYMQSRSEDGSYLKAILFARLGLTELAKEEQQKLGAGIKMASAVDATNGQRYTVERNANGEITRAFNTEGKKAGPEEIARLSAATLPTQAHQLPSVHGSPVKNDRGEVGTLMYDPQSQSTYVQVGNQKRPTTGWTTLSQNPEAVAAAAAAKKGAELKTEGYIPSGTGATGGFTDPSIKVISGERSTVEQQRLWDQSVANGTPGRLPNGNPVAKPGTSQHEGQGAIDVDSKLLTRQGRQELASKGYYQPLPNDPNHWEMLPGFKPQAAAKTPTVGEQKIAEKVAGERTQAFNKILDEEVRPQAQNGDTIVNTRKQQFAIFDRPGVDASKIFGIANGAGQSPGDQRWTMLRDVLIGKTTATDDQIRERAAQLGLNREEQSALAEYQIANAKINAATLKSTAGAGSVSDAEQRANREMNVDPTKIPAMGAYNAMAQSQFEGDKARYKADWATTHPAANALELDKAWRKESQALTKMYTDIAKERARFITENGATAAAVKEAYKRFPVPEYDPQTEKWNKTKPLSAYER